MLSFDLDIDPRDQALLHMRKGDIFSLQGEWTEAQREYEMAVRADGGLTALRKLAQAQLQRRDIRGAKSTLRKLKSAGARSEDLLLLESIVLLRTGELVKARGLLESASDSPQKAYGLALLSILEGNHEEVQVHLQTVINKWEPVLRSYARTLQAAYDEYALFPESPNIHLITLIARSLAQVQECELALPLLVQVTQKQSDYRDAWTVQGYCEFTTERYEQGLHSFERAYTLDPEKPEIQYFLGRSYGALGNHETALTFLNYALKNGFEPEGEVRRFILEEAREIEDYATILEQLTALTLLEGSTLKDFQAFVTAALALGKLQDAHIKALDATKKWPQDPNATELLEKVEKEISQSDSFGKEEEVDE